MKKSILCLILMVINIYLIAYELKNQNNSPIAREQMDAKA